MAACLACSREVRDTAALWCPYCGASLSEWETRAPHAVIAGARDGVAGPDRSMSQYGPLSDARFASGQVFASRYRIISLLGRGVMGEVYRADDLKLRQPVALKLIATTIARHHRHIERFTAEVRLAREIAHPNVCRVYDIGEADGWHFLSMEYVDGETLQSLLRRIGRLPGEKALDFARQLCAGLAAAHDRGVLHRDLKPSNIMVDGRGRIRIMDFGLAVPIGEGTIGEVAGTAAYMAPEQLAGDRATERADVFALGLVLYELFTGRVLLPVRTLAERVQVREAPPVTLASVPGIDPAVERIIRSCLENDPSRRPSSALAVAAVLPGGDPLAAALAEGRVPSLEMIAAADRKGGLSPAVAWPLLVAVVVGSVAITSQIGTLSVASSDVPKPPEVLAQRARDVLAAAGADDPVVDSEFWFAPAVQRGSGQGLAVSRTPTAVPDDQHRVKFVYRQSPVYLVPQNLFRLVTDVDPSDDVSGMSTVILDSSGRLIGFRRLPAARQRTTTSVSAPDWSTLFREAGLDRAGFVPAEPDNGPTVAHDRSLAWRKSTSTDASLVVEGATLDGHAVYFDASGEGLEDVSRNPFNFLPPAGEALLWGVVVLIFAAAAILARQHLQRGQGDRRGAWKIAVFVGCAGVFSGILRAHHVPVPVAELSFLFGLSGWTVVWAAFTWVVYVGLEPSVRRVWPHTLISWTRLMAGRVRDPLVGRDILVGLLAGITLNGLAIVRIRLFHQGPNPIFFDLALESLRSVRHFTNIAIDSLIAIQYGFATLFLVLAVRAVVRKTWVAAGLVALLSVLLGFGSGLGSSAWELLYSTIAGMFLLVMLLRIGLLAYIAMLFCSGVLLCAPVTLNVEAWYAGTSFVALLVIVALALYGFTASLAGRPLFSASA